MRVAPLEYDVLFRADDEERRAHGESVQPLEIEVATIYHVERTGLDRDIVEDIHVVQFSVGNANKSGDIAVQIQQRVHLHGGLVLAESGPTETKPDTDRLWSNPEHTNLDLGRRRSSRGRRVGGRFQSRPERNRQRRGSRATR